MAFKISLRRNQMNLSKKSAAMAIWLGKNYLNQTDNYMNTTNGIEDLTPLGEILND